MSREIVIGRYADSPVKVPGDRVAVSSHHVAITEGDDGSLQIRDLDTPNGTFIRDAEGDFNRISARRVEPNDVVRLGSAGHAGFVFTVHHALKPDQGYAYEFKQLRRHLNEQQELEARKEKWLGISGWVSSFTSMIVLLLTYVISWCLGIEMDMMLRMALMSIAPVLVKASFSGIAADKKKLMKRREKLLVCPACQRPISEFDIKQGQCSRCKAK